MYFTGVGGKAAAITLALLASLLTARAADEPGELKTKTADVLALMSEHATTNVAKAEPAGFKKGENLDIHFFIVEHVDAAGNSHRFAADKIDSSDGATLQGFSMLISTMLPEREIGEIIGVFQIGDELWSFATRSIALLDSGRLIVNTRVSVQDGGTGNTELISKEPYNSVKVIGNREQNVTEFIDVGVKIEAKPKVLDNGNVQANTKMSISEVLRENDNTRMTRVPVVSFRTVDTALEFKPGRLELLSELTIQKSIDFESGIPYLRKIPWLGKVFFAHTSRKVVNTKLYIVGGVSVPQRDKIGEYQELRRLIEEDNRKKMNKYR